MKWTEVSQANKENRLYKKWVLGTLIKNDFRIKRDVKFKTKMLFCTKMYRLSFYVFVSIGRTKETGKDMYVIITLNIWYVLLTQSWFIKFTRRKRNIKVI